MIGPWVVIVMVRVDVIAPGGMIRDFCPDCLVLFWPRGLHAYV